MSNNSCILIIDNNSEELMQLISFLEGKYDIIDAEEGLACFEQAATLCPDLILVDDSLIEPNCYEVCRGLKSDSLTGEIPIVLMSDLEDDELASELTYLNCDGYVRKPFAKDDLMEKIDLFILSDASP
jgi:CheY-like chemotaxis protein